MNQPQPRISARIDQDGSPRGSAGDGEARCPGRPVRRVDDEWRRWIAENLILGSAPQGVIDAMVADGIPLREAELETERASRSPYVRGSELLRTRLGEVDRLLASYRNHRRMHSKAGVIERRDRLSRGEFLDEYYSANRPVAIAGMMEDWPALTLESRLFRGEARPPRRGRPGRSIRGRAQGRAREADPQDGVPRVCRRRARGGRFGRLLPDGGSQLHQQGCRGRTLGRCPAGPRIPPRRVSSRRLVAARPVRGDYHFPPRTGESFHGPGHRPQSSGGRPLLEHPFDAE